MASASSQLFPKNLLPEVSHDAATLSAGKPFPIHLPDSYTMRPLQRNDYSKGMLDVLRVLTSVGDIQQEAWEERWDWMKSINDMASCARNEGGGTYYILVVENEQGKIVGTGGVVVERKL